MTDNILLDEEAKTRLRQSVTEGKHWFIALLEAISLWNSPSEIYQEYNYQYLIQGEAFDFLLLAQRLLLEIEGWYPREEADALLFEGKSPLDLTPTEFRRLIGPAKYRAHLNFVYGVIVEQALYLAVVEEVRKERRSIGVVGENGVEDEAYIRLYGKSREDLVNGFRTETRRDRRKHLDLQEISALTYWLFKLRVKQWDPSRVASDTRKGLEALQRNWKLSKLNQGVVNYLFLTLDTPTEYPRC